MNALEVNQQKIIETKALLIDIISDPAPFISDILLKSALKSQTGLAKYSTPTRNIATCSLNTFKSASESILDRGFIELDELRVNAKNAIEGYVVGSKATKTTRTGLRNKVDDLEYKLDTMKKSNFLLISIIGELSCNLKEMASSTKSREYKESEYRRINRTVEVKLNYTLKELDSEFKELNDKLKVDI